MSVLVRIQSFEPDVRRSSLPESVVERRLQNSLHYEQQEERLRESIYAHLTAYQTAVEELIRGHSMLANETDIDLRAETRWVALWELSGRCISLAHALLVELRNGLTAQVSGTSRLMFEAVSLLEAFTVAPDDLVRQWLDGKHVPQRKAREQLNQLAEEGAGIEDDHQFQALAAAIRADPRYRARAAEQKKQGAPASGGVADLLTFVSSAEYQELSHARGGHNDRPGLRDSVDPELRLFHYGPHPDPEVRAVYVQQAGHDIERVVIVVGYTLSRFFFGPAYQENRIHTLQRALRTVREERPLLGAAKSSKA